MRRKAQGFTLIEIMLVIATGVTLLAISMGAWRWVQDSNHTAGAQSQVLTLSAAVRSVFPGARYADLTTAAMRQSGLLPASLTAAQSGLLSPWGGAITVAPITRNGVANAAFRITLAGVPKTVCTTLVTNTQEHFQRIVAGASLGGGSAPIKDHFASPMVNYSTAKAIGDCTRGASTSLTLETY